MALPVTITGISTAIPTVGPFRSSTGSYYFFGVDSATATTLQAYKSTAPDTSWASIATKTGFATGIAGLTGDQDGDTIHLIVTDGTVATALNHKYQTFNMASDAFVTAETIASALATAGQTGGGQPIASLTVRSTGEVVAFFNGAQTQTTGTNRARVYYSRRTGVATWTAPIEVDASAAADAKFPVVVLGAADSVHFVWSETNLLQRTLNASNVLQTQTQYASGATTPLEGVSYSAGGQTRVLVGAGGNFVFYFNSADAPTVNASNPTSTDNRLLVDAGDTSKVWLLYRNSTDSDIYVKSSSDYGATWGTPVASLVGTTVASSLSLNGNVYQRGTGTYVVPYLVNDNGTLKYNEATVRSLAKTLYFKNVTVNGALSLQDGGSAPGAALTTTGWTVAKLAATNASIMAVGTKKASGTFSTADPLATPSFTAGSCWRSEQPFLGMFAGTNWTLTFRVRAQSAASSQTGRVECRIWKSPNADGTGATELTTGVLSGTTTAALSTTASQSSTVTWTPSTKTLYSIVTNLGGVSWGGTDTQMGGYQTFTTPSDVSTVTACTIALAKSGSPTDNITVDLFAYDTGANKPVGSSLGSCTPVAGSSISTAMTRVAFTFTAPISVLPNTKYALVFKRTNAAPDNTNKYTHGRDSVTGNFDANQGDGYWTKSTDSYSTVGTIDVDIAVTGSVSQTFNNEYLWVQCSWEVVAPSGSNSGDALFYQESAGAITTSDFVPPTLDGWSAVDKSANITLSNADKTATLSSATSAGIRSVQKQTNGVAGKWYAEFIVNALPVTVGTQDATAGLTSAAGNSIQTQNGNIYQALSVIGGITNLPQVGDRICIAWDTSQKFFYARLNNEAWNADPAIEPGRNNGLAGNTADGSFGLWMNSSTSGASVTMCPEVADIAYGVPHGYKTWMNETAPAVYAQKHFRVRKENDGNVDATPAWEAAEDIAVSVPTSGKFRIRFAIENTGLGTGSVSVHTWTLKYSKNSGTYGNIDAGTDLWASGAGQADNTAVTVQRLSTGAGAWYNGQYDNADAECYDYSLTGKRYTELEFALELADAVENDTLDFRLYVNGSPLTTYSVTPRITVVAAVVGDTLTAAAFAISEPLLIGGVPPELGQIYNFQPVALVVAPPALGTPICTFPPIAMTATDLAATAPELGTPALKVVSLLSAANLATAPPLPDTATLGQVHALTVIALAPASPALSAATLTQQHSFTAIAPAPGSPVIAAALFGQVLSLTASALAVGAPSISVTTAGQSHVLLASAFANSSLTISASAITQTHALTAAAFATPAPTLQASNVSIIVPVAAPYLTIKAAYQETIPVFSIATPDVLHAENLVVGVPIFSGPALGQTHVIVAAPLTTTAAPTIAVLGQKHVLAAPTSAVAGVPAFTAPALGQNHVFTAITAAAGVPVFGTAVLGQAGVLTAMPLEPSAPSLGVGILGQKHVLSATPLADSAPALGQPALGKVLSAANLATSIPVFGAPLLSHTLIAVDFADSVPTFTAPALGKVLSAASLAVGSPAIATLILVQQHVLTAISVADSSPVFGPAFLGQAGVLGAIPVAAGSPVLSVAVFGQKHVLTAIPLAVASPTIGQTALSKILIAIDLALSAPILGMPRLSHALVAVDLAGTSGTFGTPAIGYAFPAAALVTSAPIIGVGIFGQKHVLTAANLAVGLPVFGPAVLSGAGVLAAVPLYVSSPVLGTPAFGQKHVLAAVSLADSALSIGVSAIGQTHALVAVAIAAATPSIGVPLFKQIHALTAVNIAAAVPTIGSSIFGQTHVLTALPIATAAPVLPALTAVIYSGFAGMPAAAGAPVIDAPAFGQKHVLTAQDLAVSAPTIDASALAKKLTAVGITVSTPVISSSTLTKALTAAPLSVGASSLTAPALIAVAGLGATGLSVSVPAIGSPAFGQDHKFTAASLAVGKPVLPALSIKQASDVEPLPPDLDVPVLGTPLLKQRHVFTAVAAAAGAPELEQLSLDLTSRLVAQSFALSYPTQFAAPVFKQNHVLGAVDLVAGRPIPGTAFLGQAGVMAAVPLWVASPVLGTAAFSQRHRFTANPAVAGRPTLGIPGLVPIAVMPRPWHVYLGRFQYTAPILGQEHRLTALAASAGSPQGLLARFIEEETFEAVSLAVSATNIGTPVLTVAARFTAIGLAPQSPAQSRPALGQVHQLTARSLVVSRITFTRPNMDVVEFLPDPVDLVVGRPVIGVPDYIPALRDHAVVDIISRRRRPTIIGQRPIGSPKVDVTGRRQSTAIIGQRPIGSPKVDVTGRRGKRPVIIGRRY